MNSYIVTRLRNATPPLTDEHGRLPVRKAMIANDGDGDAFDVRVFGHNCIIRAYAWEKLPNGSWKIGERTMVPRISNEDGDDVKIAIWRPKARMTCPRMPGSASTGPNHLQDCDAADTKRYPSLRNSPTNGGRKRTGRHRTDWPNDSVHGAHTEGSTTIPKTPENHRNQPSESP